ncbi:hypothetical protein, partial [Chromobacterium haemolyticum]|uniref:hypothetical protein n=1 Tax=Chromobacterium haemolyticum TaxID=394935 RepID=UPI0013B3A502
VADGKPARGKLFTAQIWVDAQVAANALRARDVEHLSSGGRLLLEKGGVLRMSLRSRELR